MAVSHGVGASNGVPALKTLRYLIPLGVFAVIAVFLALGLKLNPREVPSPFIGKSAPAFELPRLLAAGEHIGTGAMHGRVWLLNVWASWCLACRSEHPLLNELAAADAVAIVGLNYKDAPADARQWLERLGNPYGAIAVDAAGEVGIDWGVYGVPETFVIDREGVIRYKHIGPIDRQALEQTILPLVRDLRG
ncbi:MAG: DsbE family thiol:disulfide interchange protein [Arenicellales bacterium]|nr:DsbE family thiol:disulfide interchange protein [Arenicellales bacterium]MDP6947675.1 DsbE family thiol:disulfide interchange protein [Arenicellales bacterium]